MILKKVLLIGCLTTLIFAPFSQARPWVIKGVAKPVEAELIGESRGYVVLRGENGASFELPLANFSPADQKYIRALNPDADDKATTISGKPLLRKQDYKSVSHKQLKETFVALDEPMELHVQEAGDPITNSNFNFTHPDAWLFFDQIKASTVADEFLDRMLVHGSPAQLDENVRVVQHANGAVVIPHSPDFNALQLYPQPDLKGDPLPLQCYTKYGEKDLTPTVSFLLKRGYMATLAENEDGTGKSRNYVAQDHDIVINKLPAGLDKSVKFVRVFPWRWTDKKGIAGGIHQNLNVGWFYDWNIEANSNLDLEYVAIKQKRWWPGMNQDWRRKGINHLLGFNEPDRPDQAQMTVQEAIDGWPELLGTGLRLGSPATSDGGLNWLYQFMDEAEKRDLRVDFVAVHYYRGVGNARDVKGAVSQFHSFLKNIHDRVKRPLWITEWNNGANWTNTPEPNEREQERIIAGIIKMLDETPWVERYAPYNWVQDGRKLVRDDHSLTPAGEAYRDQKSPVFFQQPKYRN